MGEFDRTADRATRPSLMKGLLDIIESSAPGLGLASILQRFHDARLDVALSSWHGDGQKVPLTPAQVTEGLGADQVRTLAFACGMSVTAATCILAELLPPVIELLAPGGNVPNQQQLTEAIDTLRRALRL